MVVVERVQAVLFDLDGTLVDSGIDFGRMRREMLELAAESGCDTGALNGADILEIRDQACARAVDSGEALRRAEARLVRIEREALERASLIPGARELLEELRRRSIKLGIVTRNSREIAADALNQYALPYDVLVAREDTPRVKPHPEHLRRALAALEAEPASAIMVGDGRMDVEAGRAGGMRTVGYLTAERPADYFDGLEPSLVVSHLGDLIPWIFPSLS
jgi:phosphoglycolate phosphatase